MNKKERIMKFIKEMQIQERNMCPYITRTRHIQQYLNQKHKEGYLPFIKPIPEVNINYFKIPIIIDDLNTIDINIRCPDTQLWIYTIIETKEKKVIIENNDDTTPEADATFKVASLPDLSEEQLIEETSKITSKTNPHSPYHVFQEICDIVAFIRKTLKHQQN